MTPLIGGWQLKAIQTERIGAAVRISNRHCRDGWNSRADAEATMAVPELQPSVRTSKTECLLRGKSHLARADPAVEIVNAVNLSLENCHG